MYKYVFLIIIISFFWGNPLFAQVGTFSEDPMTSVLKNFGTDKIKVTDIKFQNTLDCVDKIRKARKVEYKAGATIGALVSMIYVTRRAKEVRNMMDEYAKALVERNKIERTDPAKASKIVKELNILKQDINRNLETLKEQAALLKNYKFGDKDLEWDREYIVRKNEQIPELLEKIEKYLAEHGGVLVGDYKDREYSWEGVENSRKRIIKGLFLTEDDKAAAEFVEKSLGSKLLGSAAEVGVSAAGGALIQILLFPEPTSQASDLTYQYGRDNAIFNDNFPPEKICNLAFSGDSKSKKLLETLQEKVTLAYNAGVNQEIKNESGSSLSGKQIQVDQSSKH